MSKPIPINPVQRFFQTLPRCTGNCEQGDKACDCWTGLPERQRVSWEHATPQERASLDASMRGLIGMGVEELVAVLPADVQARMRADESIGPYRAGPAMQFLGASTRRTPHDNWILWGVAAVPILVIIGFVALVWWAVW